MTDSTTIATANEILFDKIKKLRNSAKATKTKSIARIKTLEVTITELQEQYRSLDNTCILRDQTIEEATGRAAVQRDRLVTTVLIRNNMYTLH